MAEAELDEEIRGLQAEDDIRGCSASQFFAMGTEQALQQMSGMQRELTKNVETQHRPAAVTPVHVLEEGEGGEEHLGDQRRRVASRQKLQPAATRGFRSVLFVSSNATEGDGDELNTP